MAQSYFRQTQAYSGSLTRNEYTQRAETQNTAFHQSATGRSRQSRPRMVPVVDQRKIEKIKNWTAQHCHYSPIQQNSKSPQSSYSNPSYKLSQRSYLLWRASYLFKYLYSITANYRIKLHSSQPDIHAFLFSIVKPFYFFTPESMFSSRSTMSAWSSSVVPASTTLPGLCTCCVYFIMGM